MAERGRFSGGRSGGGSYAGIPTQILNQIRKQAAGENTSNTNETVKPNTGDAETASSTPVAKERKPLTAEQIAANPLFSGKLSVDQAKINYIKSQQALNLMPGENVTGKKYTAQLKKANAAIAKLGLNPQETEQQFFALGGQMQGVGRSQGANYGWSGNKVLEYWRSAGMEDKGYEIVAKMYGNDKYGNPVEQSQPTVDYRLASDSTFRMQSPTANLNALQAARLTKLQNLKQSGTTLTAKQQGNLKRLRTLKNG